MVQIPDIIHNIKHGHCPLIHGESMFLSYIGRVGVSRINSLGAMAASVRNKKKTALLPAGAAMQTGFAFYPGKTYFSQDSGKNPGKKYLSLYYECRPVWYTVFEALPLDYETCMIYMEYITQLSFYRSPFSPHFNDFKPAFLSNSCW